MQRKKTRRMDKEIVEPRPRPPESTWSGRTAEGHPPIGALIAATHGPTLARYFGRRHHGAIRGAAGTAAVAGSAVAPWATAALMERSGSFGAPLLMMGLAAGALGLLCGLVRRPKPRGWVAE